MSEALHQRWSDQLAELELPPAAPWAEALRRAAADAFREAGLPHRKVEAWKYTPLAALEDPAPGLSAGAPEHAPGAVDDTGPAMVFEGGRLGSTTGNLPGDLQWTALPEVLSEPDSAFRELLAELPGDGPAWAFSTLNTALLAHGLAVHVGENADAGRLRLVFRPGDAGRLASTRLALLMAPGARLQLVVEHRGTDADVKGHLLNLVTQVRLGEGARLEVIELQECPAGASLVSRLHVGQGAGSRFVHVALDAGGRLVRRDLQVRLEGEGAEVDLAGAAPAGDGQLLDHHVRVDHAAPGCRSDQLYRALAAGRSRAVFNGMAWVHPGADGTDARQSSKNLLLDRLAEIDAKPELEIHADDVVASHGATVGQLDERALFYLRTRGLDEAQARRMLVRAFCRPVIERVADPGLREWLDERLHARLEALA